MYVLFDKQVTVCYFVMLWSNFIQKWRDKDIRRGQGNKPLQGLIYLISTIKCSSRLTSLSIL